MKILNLNKTVAQLVAEYPELKDVMASIGFKEITKPISLKLMGKIMTIPKGCEVKGYDVNEIISKLEEAGFQCVYNDENLEYADVEKKEEGTRAELLKNMIERLSSGEELEEVRKDFVKHFESVSVKEITNAEQSLIDEGMAVEKVQKLCDIHSALFHGKTEEEVITEEEQSLGNRLDFGHPISQLKLENRIIEKKIEDIEKCLEEHDREKVLELLSYLKGIKPHYAKKEELIMPLLNHYGFPGPSTVMWGVDDEIKEELSRLVRTIYNEENYIKEEQHIKGVIERMKEMIYKEEQILFPLALEYFTKEEWYHVYEDLEAMGASLVRQTFAWSEADEYLGSHESEEFKDGEIILSTGRLSVRQLMSLLDALPMDMTYIDENDHVLYFKDKMHIFPRPKSCIGKLVYDCHPARVRPVVEAMLADFRSKERTHYDVWMKNVRVRYMAIYRDDQYAGTIELVEDFSEILENKRDK